jgi:hypothetical protein
MQVRIEDAVAATPTMGDEPRREFTTLHGRSAVGWSTAKWPISLIWSS